MRKLGLRQINLLNIDCMAWRVSAKLCFSLQFVLFRGHSDERKLPHILTDIRLSLPQWSDSSQAKTHLSSPELLVVRYWS